MFLALKELKYSKAKFALIISVVVLISYLVYFLTSLAYGLASSYTNAVEKWKADELVITADSNDNIMMSIMTTVDYNSVVVNGEKSKIGLFPAVISNPLSEDILESRMNVFFIGIENDSFIKPDETKDLVLVGNKVIVDEELKKEGYKAGDLFSVAGSDIQYEIIGFSTKSTYQTAPVVYMSLSSWQVYRYGDLLAPNLFSGVVVRGNTSEQGSKLLVYTIKDYISTLPGYTAQVLTFSVMIVFLIIIVAFVLGIFIYVLTIQKLSMFGVMKAQGISNGYIGGSVVIQTFILVAIGIAIGFILTMITGLTLGKVIPFALNFLFYGVITLAFFLCALLGALFSVKAVLKIDPLKAIGG